MTNPPLIVNLDVYSDDTWSRQLPPCIDESATPPVPVDLTNCTVEAWAAESGEVAVELGASITASTSGLITLANATPPLLPGTYEYNVQVTDPTPTPPSVTTWFVGTIYVRESIASP